MKTKYENPLADRYAGKDMSYLFSDENKFKLWRKLWVVLAEVQHEMGLAVTKNQVDELKLHMNDINYEEADAFEKELRHDVMAHIRAYAKQCPLAGGIIHMGVTSCYVGDNADLIIINSALKLINQKLIAVMKILTGFVEKYKDLPTLGFTHFQAAQLTTVGKRATLWLQDLLTDYEQINFTLARFKLRGVKGATGTQASFLELFDGNINKIDELEKRILQKLNYTTAYPVTGQTYPRKFDSIVLNLLASVAQSAYKFSNDLRLLQSLKEIEEPFEKNQVGSSAMPYKRNPMRSERIGALCRYVLSLTINPQITASTQWFERTLDDSANRRIVIPQAFLATDAILNLYANIANGLVVNEGIIKKHIKEELPFMASEAILMRAVSRGGDRQLLHEKLRRHSMAASKRIKADGLSNDLLERIANDAEFKINLAEINELLDPHRFTGVALEQSERFLNDYIYPVLNNADDVCIDEIKL